MGILIFQVGIFLSFIFAGSRFRHALAVSWLFFTGLVVFSDQLFLLQTVTIAISWYIVGRMGDAPLNWWWRGWPQWAQNSEELLNQSAWYMKRRYGHIEFCCSTCFGFRCHHMVIERRGWWPYREGTIPDSRMYLNKRRRVMDEMRSVIAIGKQSEPESSLLSRLRSALEKMESETDIQNATVDFLRWIWAESHAEQIHIAKVRRLNAEDLLTVVILVAGVSAIVSLVVSLPEGIGNAEKSMLTSLMVIAGLAYLTRIAFGVYWEMVKGIRMCHYYSPEGGLVSLMVNRLRGERS